MELEIGDRVVHATRSEWGVGEVVDLRGRRAIIAFDRGGRRTFTEEAPLRTPSEDELLRSSELGKSKRRNCKHDSLPARFTFCPHCASSLRPAGAYYRRARLVKADEGREQAARDFVFHDASMEYVYGRCKLVFPEHIAFVQKGHFWCVFEDDATLCHNIFSWKIGGLGHGLNMTGIPVWRINFVTRLRSIGQPHLFVSQLESAVEGRRVDRAITEVWPERDSLAP